MEPEHIISDALKVPVTQVHWDKLVEKYGEEKVKRYHTIKAPDVIEAAIEIRVPHTVITHG